jgi:predicted alpha/beta-hydrolase family hydrolase
LIWARLLNKTGALSIVPTGAPNPARLPDRCARDHIEVRAEREELDLERRHAARLVAAAWRAVSVDERHELAAAVEALDAPQVQFLEALANPVEREGIEALGRLDVALGDPTAASGAQEHGQERKAGGRTHQRAKIQSSLPTPVSLTRVTTIEVDTPHGRAIAHLHPAGRPRAAIVLGHGAGGGVESRDLVAVTGATLSEGISVALVEQPYRVAGRRSPAPARQLDVAWTAVVDHLVDVELRGLPLLVGGRSSGARVACRTAGATAAVGVLCLAFPLQPPRRSGGAESPSRLPELDAVTVPMLVVQGVRDRFGMPPAGMYRTVVQVQGDHSLRTDLEAVADAVRAWLPAVVTDAV